MQTWSGFELQDGGHADPQVVYSWFAGQLVDGCEVTVPAHMQNYLSAIVDSSTMLRLKIKRTREHMHDDYSSRGGRLLFILYSQRVKTYWKALR